jgi:very-short-patch-repair endonuclease
MCLDGAGAHSRPANLAGVSVFGVFSAADLRLQGYTRHGVVTAVRQGRLRQVVRGWYATPDAPRDVVRAFELGGRAGCVTALAAAGAWLPPDAGLHVAMPPSASGRRLALSSPPGVTVHWHGGGAAIGSSFAASPPEAGIRHLVDCQPPWYAVAVLDSLLHGRIMSNNRLMSLLATTSSASASLATLVDGRSESGIESIARSRLALSGIPSTPQVSVAGIGRVDLLVGGWLVIELDGREFHAQEAHFSRDRRRTNLLHRDGKIVLQFDYPAVIYDWDSVEQTIRSVLQQYAPVR